MKLYKLRLTTAAGIAALFLAMAGNVHAIPFSTRDTLESHVHKEYCQNAPNYREDDIRFERTDQPGKSVDLMNFYAMGMYRGHDRAALGHQTRTQHWAEWNQPASTTPKLIAAVANVPDGGSTVIMAGLAILGLAFTRKLLAI